MMMLSLLDTPVASTSQYGWLGFSSASVDRRKPSLRTKRPVKRQSSWRRAMVLTMDVMCWHAARTEAQVGGAGASEGDASERPRCDDRQSVLLICTTCSGCAGVRASTGVEEPATYALDRCNTVEHAREGLMRPQNTCQRMFLSRYDDKQYACREGVPMPHAQFSMCCHKATQTHAYPAQGWLQMC